jgi:hypothetical protein
MAPRTAVVLVLVTGDFGLGAVSRGGFLFFLDLTPP